MIKLIVLNWSGILNWSGKHTLQEWRIWKNYEYIGPFSEYLDLVVQKKYTTWCIHTIDLVVHSHNKPQGALHSHNKPRGAFSQ